MKTKSLPLKVGIILLIIFQVYTVFTRWGEDTLGTIIAIGILVGCIVLLMAGMFFRGDKHSKHLK